jgi:replicative superfamily II helicase
MEEKLNEPVDDGVEPKDVTDVVSEALVQKTKKNRFLVNVGLRSKGSVNVERDLVEELEVEKQTSSDLREVIKTQQQQMEGMMKKFQESETTRAKQEEEAKKRQADTDKLIRNLMSMIQGCQATQ